MERCTAIKFSSFLVITLVGCASAHRGHVVALNQDFDTKQAAPVQAKVPELHGQKATPSLVSIPSDKEDAAVFYYSLGQAYSLDNETSRAIEAYRATLVYDPNSALVHARLAAELVMSGAFSEAASLCESAIKFDAKFVDSYLLLAGIHVAAKEYKKALSVYRQALVQSPTHRDALLYYGVTLAEVGKYKEAIVSLQKLVGLKETSESQIDQSVAAYYLAKVQQQAGQSTVAIQTLNTALQKRAGFVKAALLLAEIYHSQKQPALARKTLEEVFRESPDADVASQLAEVFLTDGKYENAVVYLETLVEEDPGNENLRLKLALVYWQLKWLDKSHRVFSEIISRHPTSSEMLFYMAELELERLGPKAALPYYQAISSDFSKYEQATGRAVAIYREAKQYVTAENLLINSLQKRPDIISFYPLLAALYEDEQRLSDARDILELGRKRYPEEESILYYLGFVYDRVGEKDKGFATMESLLALNPNNANALNFLGYTLLERNVELDRAGTYLSTALRLKPNDAFVIDSYGWYLFKTGQGSQAMKLLERAHAIKPEEALIVEHLADVYLALNLKSKALEAYKKSYAMSLEVALKERVGVKLSNLESAIAASDGPSIRRGPAMARPPMPTQTERAPASSKKTNY